MPDLPTLTVTTAQANRMLAAFGSAANYREWLRARIVDEVKRVETRSILVQADADQRAKAAEIDAALPSSAT
jgi:hypothetical protein